MNRNATILLTEDNDDHVVLIQEAFKKAGWLTPVQAVRSGSATKAYLAGEGELADRSKFPYPVCLLLDLNMPGMDGIEVLKWIRAQANHKRLLVFILTSNRSESQSRLVYDLAANSLIHKPVDFAATVEMAKSIRDYLEVIQLPPPPQEY
jgi:two-component system response regulator